jgi:hypothetical protein
MFDGTAGSGGDDLNTLRVKIVKAIQSGLSKSINTVPITPY